MSKQVKAVVKLQIKGGAANPAPPVGNNLGQHKVNIMNFCKQFNDATADRRGEVVPVQITIYIDSTFKFAIFSPPVSALIKKYANISKGSQNPGTKAAGAIKLKDIVEIATLKLKDLNSYTLERAVKEIKGSARSMGIEVVD